MGLMAEDRDFLFFVQAIRSKTGIDLTQYKEAQMKRRLTTLRDKRGFSCFEKYGQALLKDKVLLDELLDRMTINVSEFFRNSNRWEVIEKKVFPDLLQTNRRLRCWSAACSTGEEPYTMAMILASLTHSYHIHILATDLDEGALNKAQLGVYMDRSIREVPMKYKHYFKQDGSIYRLSEDIKRCVTFRRQNLLKDPFESGFDLIVCRNVMIYFTEHAKHELYQKLGRALRSGGYLFVGSTEQIFQPAQYGFETADTFVYRKI